MSRLVPVTLGLLCSLAPARAAQVTEMAPAMGLAGGLTYGGSHLSGKLVEDGEVVSGRRITRHDLDLGFEFAPTDGVALTLAFAITPSWRFAYPDSRTMVVEPLDGSGSYLSGAPVAETPTIEAAGLEGIWIGGAVAPFAERYARAQATTWRLDAALRTPSAKRNLWTAPNGKRGPSPGGLGLRVAGAFSTDLGVGEPWLRVEYLDEGKVTLDVIDEAGVTWATDLQLAPASSVDATAGIEIVAVEVEETGSRAAVDLSFGAGYRTWEDVASGVYLPNVLDGARSIPVTAGDTVDAHAGVALAYDVNPFLRVRTGTTFTYRLPFRPEHVYPVTTSADTWQLGWFFQVSGRGSFAPPEVEPLD